MLTLVVTKDDGTQETHCFDGDKEKNLQLIEEEKLKYDNATFEVIDDEDEPKEDENGQ